MNGGRNYNGPKVNNSLALVKLNYMRENPPQLSGTRRQKDGSKNSADMGTIRREGSQWRTLRDFTFSHTLGGWRRNGWWGLLMEKVASSLA